MSIPNGLSYPFSYALLIYSFSYLLVYLTFASRRGFSYPRIRDNKRKEYASEEKIFFSSDDQLKIESIATIEALHAHLFPSSHIVPFHLRDRKIRTYNPYPLIHKKIPYVYAELIKTWSKKLNVRVDKIDLLTESDYAFARAGYQVDIHEEHARSVSCIWVNVDAWNKSEVKFKDFAIIHELAHLALQHSYTLGIDARVQELQADTFFPLCEPDTDNEIMNTVMAYIVSRKDEHVSRSYVHPSFKELYTILTHAQNLKKKKHTQQIEPFLSEDTLLSLFFFKYFFLKKNRDT